MCNSMFDTLNDRLNDICVQQFEQHLDRLAAAHKRGQIIVSSPVSRELAVAIEDISRLRRVVRAA
jgi:hypothetical protein